MLENEGSSAEARRVLSDIIVSSLAAHVLDNCFPRGLVLETTKTGDLHPG